MSERPLTTIFLDADGTHDLGHYVLVPAPTGIRYETQCGGLRTLERSAEGFLVSVGPARQAAELCEYVRDQFASSGQRPASEWSEEPRAELARRLGEVLIWVRGEDGEDEPTPLELDTERLSDCLEAWIPVRTPFGPAWLLGPNSD